MSRCVCRAFERVKTAEKLIVVLQVIALRAVQSEDFMTADW